MAQKKKINDTHSIRIERIWSMPNKNTFDILPIKDLLKEEVDMSNFWIDPFANKNKLATVTNDLSLDYDTDYHVDALDFLKMFGDNSVDGVLYDPPYSPRQVSECYNDVGYNVTWDTTKASFWGNHKREISRIVKPGGKVITFGWNSGGIGYKYGFEIQRILLVPHGGWHNDTIVTVEIKTHEGEIPRQEETHKKEKEPRMLTDNDLKLIAKLKELPLNYWDFKEEDTKEYTHGIHNYPAMMVCPISRNIIRLVKEIQPVTALFDPFSGSGTVLVEGMLSGIPVVAGNDINPLALFLTKNKTTRLNVETLNTEYDALINRINARRSELAAPLAQIDSYMTDTLQLDLSSKKGWGDKAPDYLKAYCKELNINITVPHFKNLGYWFKPFVIIELAVIKEAIDVIQDQDIRDYFFIAFSESIRLVSNRRNGEFKMFRIKADKIKDFKPNVQEEFTRILKKNIEKMADFCTALDAANANPNVSIFRNNACTLEDVPNDTYDLVVTSPPYGDSRTTVAYGEYSRLSLFWINPCNSTEEEILSVDKSLMGGQKFRNGFELSINSPTLRTSLEIIKDIDLERAGDVYSFYLDLDSTMASVSRKTKSGGYQFWVVGNRTVKNENLLTDVIISEMADSHGLEAIYTVSRNIPNKVMPSQNSPSNVSGEKVTTMTTEHIVILRKR